MTSLSAKSASECFLPSVPSSPFQSGASSPMLRVLLYVPAAAPERLARNTTMASKHRERSMGRPPLAIDLPATAGCFHGRACQVRLEARLAERGRAGNAFQPKRLDVAELEDEVTRVIPGLARQHLDGDVVETVEINGLVDDARQPALDDDPPVGKAIANANERRNPHEVQHERNRNGRQSDEIT